MLGTIEEMEKSIEQFQNNVAATGELVQLLKQMLEQIKQQNSDFDGKAQSLIDRLDKLPGTVEDANSSSNEKIRADISTEMDKSLGLFADEQGKYIQNLGLVKQQIQNYIEQLQAQEKIYSEKTQTIIAKVESVIAAIEAENIKSNGVIKDEVLAAKEEARKEFDNILKVRNEEFAKEQTGYISSLKETQDSVKKCEEQLTAKYKEFVDSLEKMNISNLYEQNIQLKKQLNSRTLILMLISGLSVVIAILGLFM